LIHFALVKVQGTGHYQYMPAIDGPCRNSNRP